MVLNSESRLFSFCTTPQHFPINPWKLRGKVLSLHKKSCTRQNNLCLVDLRRAECMEGWRQEHFVHGAIFREHQSSECLLPIRRTGRCLSGREERVRPVRSVRPLPARFGIFAGSNVEKTADGIHIPSAIVPIHQKRQWRFHGAQCLTLCQFLAIHFGKTRVPITRKG